MSFQLKVHTFLAAGIPDFRSSETGLYHNLQKYKLPYPTAIFEVDYFVAKPKPFFALAKELYPGTFKPTPCHYFVKLLHEKGLLVRHYTQNIDTLERIAGIPAEKLVEAHGTFYTNHCLGCRKEYSMDWMKGTKEHQPYMRTTTLNFPFIVLEKIFDDIIPTCTDCNKLVKPDIVFFGENLPDTFYQLPPKDFKKCDLLIIMGTSLEVQPFASLIERVNSGCVRLLINREAVGETSGTFRSFLFNEGFHFNQPGNKRDVCWLGDCDDGIKHLAKELGFEVKFNEMRLSFFLSEPSYMQEELSQMIEDEWKELSTNESTASESATNELTTNESTDKTNDVQPKI